MLKSSDPRSVCSRRTDCFLFPRRLQFVTSRESSLFIFHALGKVLYNKRRSTSPVLASPSPLFHPSCPSLADRFRRAGWGDTVEDDKKDLNRPGILQNHEYDKLPKHLRKTDVGRRASKVDPDVRLHAFLSPSRSFATNRSTSRCESTTC
jgi:hypothetical protein